MSPRSVLRAVFTATLGLAIVAGTFAAASADAFRHRDATGDVYVRVVDSSGVRSQYVDPSEKQGDIQQFTVLHSRWVLSIATSLRALNSNYGNGWLATIRTSTGDRFTVESSTDESVDGLISVGITRNGNLHFACDGLHVSRTSSGVIAKVPTRCLGNPWKVRVGVRVGVDHAGLSRNTYDSVADDALRTGVVYTDRDPLPSPWIAR